MDLVLRVCVSYVLAHSAWQGDELDMKLHRPVKDIESRAGGTITKGPVVLEQGELALMTESETRLELKSSFEFYLSFFYSFFFNTVLCLWDIAILNHP